MNPGPIITNDVSSHVVGGISDPNTNHSPVCDIMEYSFPASSVQQRVDYRPLRSEVNYQVGLPRLIIFHV